MGVNVMHLANLTQFFQWMILKSGQTPESGPDRRPTATLFNGTIPEFRWSQLQAGHQGVA